MKQFPVAVNYYYKNQWLLVVTLLVALIIVAFKPQPVQQSEPQQIIVHTPDHREPDPHPNVDEIEVNRYYQLKVTDDGDKIILYDGKRVVDVFYRDYPQNRRLFKALDRDNDYTN